MGRQDKPKEGKLTTIIERVGPRCLDGCMTPGGVKQRTRLGKKAQMEKEAQGLGRLKG